MGFFLSLRLEQARGACVWTRSEARLRANRLSGRRSEAGRQKGVHLGRILFPTLIQNNHIELARGEVHQLLFPYQFTQSYLITINISFFENFL